MNKLEKRRIVLLDLDYTLTKNLLGITDVLSSNDEWWKWKDYLEDNKEQLDEILGCKLYDLYMRIAEAGIHFTSLSGVTDDLVLERDNTEALLNLHMPVRDCLARQIALIPPENRPKNLLTKTFQGPIHTFYDEDERPEKGVAVGPVSMKYLVENVKLDTNCKTNSIALYNEFRRFLENWYLKQYESPLKESDKDLALTLTLIERCENCPYDRLNI